MSEKYTSNDICFEKLINLYIEARLEDSLSEHTTNYYANRLHAFRRWLKDCINISKISYEDIHGCMDYLDKDRRLKISSRVTELYVLKHFFVWLLENNIISKNPSSRISAVKYDRKNLRRALQPKDIEQLRNACSDIHEKAIFELFYSTGCRVSELAEIDIRNIDFKDRSIFIMGKGKKERIVFFSVTACNFLNNYLHNSCRESDALFVSKRGKHERLSPRMLEKIISNIGEKSGIDSRVYPHILRHSFATHFVATDMRLEVLQHLMGHERIDTTQIYTEISYQKIKSEYEKSQAQKPLKINL
ncbi:MAG: tyrosine-type recombinase/integrase [Clostridiales bacterium]|nr:tyrosine-type recombinase/integrase [Clostridiales bacterium]